MAREEVLRRRPPLLTLANFNKDLAGFVADGEAAGESTRMVLVTYNRVGEGLLGFTTYKGGLNLDLIQGTLDFNVSPEQVTELVFGSKVLSASKTAEEVDQFYQAVGEELVGLVDRQTVFIVYAGENEKFQAALDLIDNVSISLRILGIENQAKFFLLTCNCGLAKKVHESGPLYANGSLRGVIYNPKGECGGFADLQTIAETALDAIPD